jgi:hypothetical protein
MYGQDVTVLRSDPLTRGYADGRSEAGQGSVGGADAADDGQSPKEPPPFPSLRRPSDEPASQRVIHEIRL